jgi:hypothetical protein
MNHHYTNDEAQRVGAARDSFAGRLLTDSQFSEAIAITGILESEIRKSGTFKEKLGDYSHAFARTEKFDAMKAESALRDLFKARTGQSMNQLREELMDRENELDNSVDEQVKTVTRDIGPMIKEGNKMPFHRAYDFQASVLATNLGITNAGAKRLMTEVFRQEADGELYDWGKGLEDKYYRPQIEAEKAERQSAREKPAQSRRRSRNRQPA